jgi:U6 snRNA-associated Sm-like protein LSm2
LVGKQVTVELKNDLQLTGTLVSVDQYLCIKLDNVQVDTSDYPQLVIIFYVLRLIFVFNQTCIKSCFIRGSVLRYVHLPKNEVQVDLLQDATRRESGLNTSTASVKS